MLLTIKKIFLNVFFKFIFLSDSRVDLAYKTEVWAKMVMSSSIVIFISDWLGIWFQTNKQFATFVLTAIVINAGLGMWKHMKHKTFRWEIFFKKTGLMVAIVILSYVLLEMLVNTAGNNYITDGFKVMIQVSTLFYPSSKALKNIFILSSGEYPPKWLMEKVYNFESDGNLSSFLSSNLDNTE